MLQEARNLTPHKLLVMCALLLGLVVILKTASIGLALLTLAPGYIAAVLIYNGLATVTGRKTISLRDVAVKMAAFIAHVLTSLPPRI